jgi:hypothetical protein
MYNLLSFDIFFLQNYIKKSISTKKPPGRKVLGRFLLACPERANESKGSAGCRPPALNKIEGLEPV